ncbi:hypothetical protein KHA93_14500 [Bacillus sp. FJAT-49732]|uniref:Uncharacterized protein n=1 Tax=Lederbergia citrisecunda TaxID=2833583 RepID=A0A942TP31_9BACI|nr:hypothetical protein [Lederbergia citrisecunda]MBS4200843.1 hypothetical protein [Lederbergia citrisecunda]
MINLYVVEKRIEQEERERRRIANQAWMTPKPNKKNTLMELLEAAFRKSVNFKKHTRKMYDF